MQEDVRHVVDKFCFTYSVRKAPQSTCQFTLRERAQTSIRTSDLLIGLDGEAREHLQLGRVLPRTSGRDLPNELERVDEDLEVDFLGEVVRLDSRLNSRVGRRCVLQTVISLTSQKGLGE